MAAAEKGAEQVELDDAPEFHDGRFDHIVVLWRRAARIVVQYVEVAELIFSSGNRRADADLIAHVGLDRDGAVARKVCSLLGRGKVDVGHRHARAFTREQDGRGASDARRCAGDECHFAVKTCHALSFGLSLR